MLPGLVGHTRRDSGSERGHGAAGDGENSPFRQKQSQEMVQENWDSEFCLGEQEGKKKNPNYTFPPKEYDYVKKHMLSLLWHFYL